MIRFFRPGAKEIAASGTSLMRLQKIIWIITLWFASISVGRAQTTLSTAKVSYQVNAGIDLPKNQGHIFIYQYTIINEASSTQNIWVFNVVVPTWTVSNIAAPTKPHWTILLSNRGWINWGALSSSDDISPGNMISGFAFQSTGVPDITDSFAQGDAPDPAPVNDVTQATQPLLDVLNDSAHVMTIGPSTFTFTNTSLAIDRLIFLKHQSVSLGWLHGEALVKELDEKLEQAKKDLVKDHESQTRNELEQFIRELKEQQKKQLEERENKNRPNEGEQDRSHDKNKHHIERSEPFMNDNAFYLLKANAEFIISKLPEKSKGDRDGGDNNNGLR